MNININLIIVIFYLTFYLKCGLLFLLIPFSIIYFYLPKYKIIINIIKNIILSSISFVIQITQPINLNVNSQKLFNEMVCNSDHKNIIISNHLAELDPLIMTYIFTNTNVIDSKIIFVSKKTMGYITPSFGIIGMFTNDIFLDRNINIDNKKLLAKKKFSHLLLFPEGTCFTKENKFKSNEFCKKNNLPIFKYHLYPRITGLDLILKSNHDIKYIYDIDIVYNTIGRKKYGLHYDIFYFVLNEFLFPKKIFLNINRYKINKNDKININNQIQNIYIKKDEFVKKFNIDNNNFVPIKYNYLKGMISFIGINIPCLLSIYFLYKFNYCKYLYLGSMIGYYVYFYFYG